MSVDHDGRDILRAEPDSEIVAPTGSVVPRPRWRRPPTARALLVAALLAAGGFTGGVLTAKHEGVTAASGTTSASRGVPTGAAGARTGGFAGQGTTSGTGASTIGTVKLVDGSTIYVTTADGSVVKVTTSGATKLSVSSTGKAADLKAGQTIVVQGTTDATGGVTATSVTESSTTSSAAGGSTTNGNAAPAVGGAPASSGPAGAPAGAPAG